MDPQSDAFLEMLRNANDSQKSYQQFYSLLYQQPVIIHYGLQQKPKGDHAYSIEKSDTFVFNYGSWEFEIKSYFSNENQTIIYIFKEEYVLDKVADIAYNKFCRTSRKKSKKIEDFIKIERNESQIRMICIDPKNSTFVKFFTSKFSQKLYILCKFLSLDKVYRNLLFSHVDKVVELPVRKYISMDRYKYKFEFILRKTGIVDELNIRNYRNYYILPHVFSLFTRDVHLFYMVYFYLKKEQNDPDFANYTRL